MKNKKEMLLGAITNLECQQPQQWSESSIAVLRSIVGDLDRIERMKRTLQKIVEAGELWGSEGKEHHNAIYLAKCSLAINENA